MANEGSTKPTYSELEVVSSEAKSLGYCPICKANVWSNQERVADEDGVFKHPLCVLQARVRELESELARVRGLLQRQWISVSERWPEIYDSAHGDWRESEIVLLWWASGDYAAGRFCEDEQGTRWWLAGNIDAAPSSVSHWQPIAPPTFPQSSELVPSGAESADIGKLDTADKSAGCICRWVDGCPVHGEPDVKGALAKLKDALAGSAETGGEKPTGPGPESREPEKLNNVQKSVCRWCGKSKADCVFANYHDFEPAESSLSSPPPKCICPPMHLAPCPLSTPDNYVLPKGKL